MDLGLALHVDATPVAEAGQVVKQTRASIVTDMGAMDAAAQQQTATLAKLSPVAQQLARRYEELRTQVRTGSIAHEEFMRQQQAILDQLAKLPTAAGAAADQQARLAAATQGQVQGFGAAAGAAARYHAEIAASRLRVTQLGEAALAIVQHQRQLTDAQRQGEQTLVRYTGSVQHQINQLKGLQVEGQKAAALEQRLIDLRTRLAAVPQRQATAALFQGPQQLVAPGVGFASSATALVAQQRQLAAVRSHVEGVTGAVRSAAQASTSWASGLDRVQRPLQAVLIGATGLPGPLGRAAAALGTLAIGGPITIGVLAAAAAITAVWQRMTAASRELAQAEEARRERAAAREAEQPETIGLGLAEDLQAAIEARDAAITQIEDLKQRLAELDTLIATGARSGVTANQDLSAALADKERLRINRQINEEESKRRTEDRTAQLAQQAADRQNVTAIRQRLELAKGFLDLQVDTATQIRAIAQEEAQLRNFAADASKDAAARLQALQIVAGLEAERERVARERQAQAAQLADAELDAAVAVLRLRGDIRTADQLILRQRLEAIEREVRALESLTASERERLTLARALLVVVQETARQVESVTARLNQTAKAQAAGGVLDLQRAISTAGPPPRLTTETRTEIDAQLRDELRQATDEANDAIQRQLDVLQREIDLRAQGEQAALDYLAALNDVDAGVVNVLAAISALVVARQHEAAVTEKLGADTIQAAEAAKAAQVAMASLVAALGQIVFTGNSAAATVGRGITTGVSAGLATGNPLIGVGAGVIGTVGGLLSGGEQRRQEIEALEQAFGDFAARSLPPVAQELRQLAREFQVLHDEARRLGQNTGELTREYVKQAAAIRERFATEERQFNEELRIRQLLAQGLDEGAASAQQALDAERELAEARLRGYSPATIAALELTQALEQQAAASDAAAEAARRQAEADQGFFTREGIMQDVIAREKRLAGDTRGADVAEIVGESVRKQAEAHDLLTRGILDEAQYRRLLNVILQEEAEALRNLDAAILKATEAELAKTRALQEDLDVRFLRATGQTEAADDREFTIQQERERQRAVEAGWTQDMLDYLDQILGIERQNYFANKETAGAVTQEARRRATQTQLAHAAVLGVTEGTAEHLVQLFSSSNVYLREIAWNTGALRGQPVPTARTVGAVVPGAAGPAVTNVGPVNVNVQSGTTTGPLDQNTLRLWGDQIAAEIHRKQRLQSSARGNPQTF